MGLSGVPAFGDLEVSVTDHKWKEHLTLVFSATPDVLSGTPGAHIGLADPRDENTLHATAVLVIAAGIEQRGTELMAGLRLCTVIPFMTDTKSRPTVRLGTYSHRLPVSQLSEALAERIYAAYLAVIEPPRVKLA